ncbi:MAG: glycine zipper family protein [Proteobacteria bacterium]|nr:glycine zipper family protein [Pseudomonadota bacterium]
MSCIRLVMIVSTLALSACASNQPIVYPNAHSQTVGNAQTQHDIAECKALAESAGTSSSNAKANTMATNTVKGGGIGAATGAVGGAIAGQAGRGAAIGAASGATAGLIHSLFGDSSPNPTYQKFVTRCMNDRGYELAGWD